MSKLLIKTSENLIMEIENERECEECDRTIKEEEYNCCVCDKLICEECICETCFRCDGIACSDCMPTDKICESCC